MDVNMAVWTTMAGTGVCAGKATGWQQTNTTAVVGWQLFTPMCLCVCCVFCMCCKCILHYWGLTLLLLDIDECTEGTSGCTQECSNSDGNYSCSCELGYHLGEDRHTCFGEWVGRWLGRPCSVSSGWGCR